MVLLNIQNKDIKMKTFKGCYEIVIDAKTALQGALDAEYILNHMQFRPEFKISEMTQNGITDPISIDLEKQ
jgi:hypothetical protein